jgi:hypothetical protein
MKRQGVVGYIQALLWAFSTWFVDHCSSLLYAIFPRTLPFKIREPPVRGRITLETGHTVAEHINQLKNRFPILKDHSLRLLKPEWFARDDPRFAKYCQVKAGFTEVRQDIRLDDDFFPVYCTALELEVFGTAYDFGPRRIAVVGQTREADVTHYALWLGFGDDAAITPEENGIMIEYLPGTNEFLGSAAPFVGTLTGLRHYPMAFGDFTQFFEVGSRAKHILTNPKSLNLLAFELSHSDVWDGSDSATGRHSQTFVQRILEITKAMEIE